MSEPQSKKVKMPSSLAQLKEITTIVADTGDFQGEQAKKLNEPLTQLIQIRSKVKVLIEKRGRGNDCCALLVYHLNIENLLDSCEIK